MKDVSKVEAKRFVLSDGLGLIVWRNLAWLETGAKADTRTMDWLELEMITNRNIMLRPRRDRIIRLMLL